MAFSKVSLPSSTWTLIGNNLSTITFQNVGQQQIYINITSTNTAPTESVGFVYDIWQGESSINLTATGRYVWARSIANVGSVVVDITGTPISNLGNDRELVVSTYLVKTAFTGASVGDTVTATQIIDVDGSPTTISTIWRNQSTGADFASVPAAINLTLVASNALTDAQLRATPIDIALSASNAYASGTREHNTAGITRQSVGVASARAALPTLGTSREVYVMATQRCFFLTGSSSVVATAGSSHPLAQDERFYFRVPAGHTHIAYIRDTTDGNMTICAVV